MCILFCEILFSTDLGTEYECNHWISYPKQKKKVPMFSCESPQKIQYSRSQEQEMQPKCTEDSSVIWQ